MKHYIIPVTSCMTINSCRAMMTNGTSNNAGLTIDNGSGIDPNDAF